MSPNPVKLTLEVKRPKDILERYYPNGRLGGLVLDGPAPAAVGHACDLLVRVTESAHRHLNVRGQLAWARHKGSSRLKACFGVDFVADDKPGRERLLQFANEKLAAADTRYDNRISTNLRVKLAHGGTRQKEALVDLSQGGAFVHSRTPLPVNSLLEFSLRPPLTLNPIKLRVRVAWVRTEGLAPGMGLEFVYQNSRQVSRVRKLVDKLSAPRA